MQVWERESLADQWSLTSGSMGRRDSLLPQDAREPRMGRVNDDVYGFRDPSPAIERATPAGSEPAAAVFVFVDLFPVAIVSEPVDSGFGMNRRQRYASSPQPPIAPDERGHRKRKAGRDENGRQITRESRT